MTTTYNTFLMKSHIMGLLSYRVFKLNMRNKKPLLSRPSKMYFLSHKNGIYTLMRGRHICLHSRVLLNWCCAPSMVQFSNTIFCSLASFELFLILGVIFKQNQVTNHLMDENLPFINSIKTDEVGINVHPVGFCIPIICSN